MEIGSFVRRTSMPLLLREYDVLRHSARIPCAHRAVAVSLQADTPQLIVYDRTVNYVHRIFVSFRVCWQMSVIIADCGLVGKLHLNPADRRLELGRDDWWQYRQEYYFQGREQRIDDGYSEFDWDHAPSDHWPASDYRRWVDARGGRIEMPFFNFSG